MEDYIWTDSFFTQFTQLHGDSAYSQQFRACLERDLAIDLKTKTGIHISEKKGKFSLFYRHGLAPYYTHLDKISYASASTSTLNLGHPAQIAWQSKSGRVYAPADPDIDPDDIHFWFSELEAEAIRDRYFKQKPKLRFNTEHLGFGLEIDHFFEEGVYLEVFLCENPPAGAIASIQATFAETVNAWNTKSEQQQGRQGYIHSYDAPHVGERNITLYLDLGSASQKGLKKVLEALRDLGTIEKIRITSFPDI